MNKNITETPGKLCTP